MIGYVHKITLHKTELFETKSLMVSSALRTFKNEDMQPNFYNQIIYNLHHLIYNLHHLKSDTKLNL